MTEEELEPYRLLGLRISHAEGWEGKHGRWRVPHAVCERENPTEKSIDALIAEARPDRRAAIRGCFLKPCCGSPGQALNGAICRKNKVKSNCVFKRFRRWVLACTFTCIFNELADDQEFEYGMIGGTICKVHRHGQGAKGGPKKQAFHPGPDEASSVISQRLA